MRELQAPATGVRYRMHSAEGRTRYTGFLLTSRSSLPPQPPHPFIVSFHPLYAPVVQQFTLDNPPT